MHRYTVSFEVFVDIDAECSESAETVALEAIVADVSNYVDAGSIVSVRKQETKDEEDLDDIIHEMEKSQKFIRNLDGSTVKLCDLIGCDVAEEIGVYIGSCVKRDIKFQVKELYIVMNGAYPYHNGVNIVGLDHNIISMEIKHRYKRWDMDTATIRDTEFEPMTTEESFIKYFQEYETRLRYCNDDRYSIVDDDLKEQYNNWLTKSMWMTHGGSTD